MAIPDFRAFTTGGAGGNATVATCNKPTGTVADDILVFILYRERNTPIEDVTWPSGFTEFGEDIEVGPSPDMVMSLAWKRAGGSEPADYSASWASSSYREARLCAFLGCKTSGSPINAQTAVISNAANQTDLVLTQITTTVADCLLVAAATAFSGASYTEPGTMTQRIDADVFGVCDEDRASAAATGSRTYTRNANSYQLGILFALAPAGVVITIEPSTLTLPMLVIEGEVTIEQAPGLPLLGSSRREMGDVTGGSRRIL